MYSYEYNRDKANVFNIALESTVSTHKHFHNCMEFIYAIDGAAELHIDGRDYTLSGGELCAISSFSPHYYVTKREGKFIVCLIPRRFFREYESVFNVGCFKNPVLKDNGDKAILNIFKILLDLAGGRDIYGEKSKPSFSGEAEKQCIFLSGFLVSFCIGNCGLYERQRISSLAADAVDVIENNFASKLTIGYISKKIGCRQKELSYHFTKTMGMSVLAYINRTRVIEAATLLLSNPDETVESIMLRCGFNNMPGFLRHFKEAFGCTPTEYKERDNIQIKY